VDIHSLLLIVFFAASLGLVLEMVGVEKRPNIHTKANSRHKHSFRPLRAPYREQPVRRRAVIHVRKYPMTANELHTFFSSSESSFHLAPSSLPTSPNQTVRIMKNLATRQRTEAGVRVLGLDPLAPVLAKEHIGRESTLGCLGVLLGLGGTGRLFSLLGSFTLHGMVSFRL